MRHHSLTRVALFASLALAFAGRAGPQAQPSQLLEIITAEVDRHLLAPALLSPEWFFLDQRLVGKAYVLVPGGSDINQWLTSFEGLSMTILAFQGPDYEVGPNERGVRGVVSYTWDSEDKADNFFVADIGLVVKMEMDANHHFAEQRNLSKKLKELVGREIVLIFRPVLNVDNTPQEKKK